MTPAQLELYRRLLDGMPAQEVVGAVDRCLRESPYMPKPAEILAAAGRSPEALADKALTDALAWVREWGPSGVRRLDDEQRWQVTRRADGTSTVRMLPLATEKAPALPCRTERALCAMAGSQRRALERLLEVAEDPERYARFRREFVAAWKEAR